jgi:hypothetical protein
MKVIKRFKLVEVDTNIVNGQISLSLDVPNGDLYSVYDSEEEAIEQAFKKGRYSNWAIIPIISFDNY